jgi:hypothetical protein
VADIAPTQVGSRPRSKRALGKASDTVRRLSQVSLTSP